MHGNNHLEDLEEMAEEYDDNDQDDQANPEALPKSFTYAEEGNDSDENIFRNYLEKNK